VTTCWLTWWATSPWMNVAPYDISSATLHICRHYFPSTIYEDAPSIAEMGLTPQSRVLLETVIVSQLVDKFSAFYKTRSLITVFISTIQLVLILRHMNSTHAIQSSLRSILILSSRLCLGLPNRLFPSYFPISTRPNAPHAPFIPSSSIWLP
jgi:hypothetical protein